MDAGKDNNQNKSWYQKRRYWLLLAGFFSIFALGSNDVSQVEELPTPTSVSIVQEKNTNPQNPPRDEYLNSQVKTVNDSSVSQNDAPDSNDVQPDTNLSNDSYYTNSAGNQVHSPAYSDSVPAGASARCRDGTYSFSQSSRGTCSHHGGVAEWL